jgi:hypothetical protein
MRQKISVKTLSECVVNHFLNVSASYQFMIIIIRNTELEECKPANAFSDPVTTIAAMFWLDSNPSIALETSVISPSHKAFKALGLFKVMRPMFLRSPLVSTFI